MNLHHWKKLFLAKGVYNILGSVVCILFPTAVLQWFAPQLIHNSHFFFFLFLMHALVFGIGFVLVGFEVHQNHVVILTGALAMFSLFLIFMYYYFSGTLSALALIPALIDLASAILFAIFWWTYEWPPTRDQQL